MQTMKNKAMELEYKLANFIDSCLNEGQLLTARNCYIHAATLKRITQEQYVFLRKLADHKERKLQNQTSSYTQTAVSINNEIVYAAEVDIFAETPLPPNHIIRIYEPKEVTAENVAKVAEGLSIKERLTKNVFIGFPSISETPFSKRNIVNDIDAD
jgi:hypothetical protein